jgi:type I restriction enzyme R subunit
VNTGNDELRLAAEQRARVLIDRQLADAGWSVQDKQTLNLFASDGVACREVVMKAGHGRADYLLYVDKKVVGVIEAKPEGTTLSGVEWQSAMYANGLPAEAQLRAVTVEGRLPFVFEASGSETHFTNGYDPHPRSRRIFDFPKPETLAKVVRDAETDSDNRRGAPRSATSPSSTSHRCALPRSPPSRASRRASPTSISTVPWCRWPREPARPSPLSRWPTGC